MTRPFDEIDLAEVSTIPIARRKSKVTIDDFGRPVKGGKSFRKWFKSLPQQLASKDLLTLASSMRASLSRREREIVWMAGAHVVKCGLSLYLVELMNRGYVTALALNGAGLIHDMEIASFGETSEDVPAALEDGTFGFAEETAEICFEAVREGVADGLGLGQAAGRHLVKNHAPHAGYSLLAAAYRLGIPATVHVAIGTDIVHQHPGFDGSAWGGLSARDFRIFAGRIKHLGDAGGVALNIGSAVILPEVFLKAVSIARNLGSPFDRITTCNLDMIRQYRPAENVLRRPGAFGGRAISITGHHEIMIPLLFSALSSGV